jgi:deoxyadenosine/deoxycytidine kinase
MWQRFRGEVTLILWLSGPTGSGKTSLTNLLSNLGFGVVREEVSVELFKLFIADPWKHCESLQEALMRARHRQFQLLPSNERVVFDRSLDEDISVFCRLHHSLGYLDASSLSRLDALAEKLKADLPLPDLIIYLSVDEAILQRRIEASGHPRIIIDALEQQVLLYNEWVSGRSEAVLKVNNEQYRPEMLNAILQGM